MKHSFKKSFMSLLTLLALTFSALRVTPAYATSTALATANALFENQALITGASYTTIANDTQTAVFNTALGGFPRGADTDFSVMSTGNTDSIPNPGTFADTDHGGGNIRGNSDYDVTILKIDFDAPAGMTCLTFQFRFFSEEYPGFVGSSYNDAFIAELDTSNWTTSGSAINAPNNFAMVSGAEVSVNSLPMSATNGAGTAFDGTGADTNGGASTLGFLAARTPLTPGSHSLYLSIFDQGDQAYDSAVFLDNLILDNTAVCTSGAFYQDPEVNVKGNDVSITSGDNTPSTSDSTDFESAEVSGGTVDRTFTIENTGNYGLELSGSPLVSVGGTNASDFTVSADPTSPVAVNSSTTFTVSFNPSGVGVRTATISIANTDANENPYTFDVQGTGVDTTVPTTTLTQHPPQYTTSTSATFSFSGNDDVTPSGNLTFKCGILVLDWQDCTSPTTFTNLPVGPHQFYVYAIDEAGNADPIQGIYYWTVQAERAKNGGLNTYTGTSKIPTSWTAANFAATDGKDTASKKEGTASVKIAGQSGKTKTLTQTMIFGGANGNRLDLSFWVKGASIPTAGLCQAKVLVYDGVTLKQTKTVSCNNGTYATFQKKTLSFNATSKFTKVVVVFTYNKASGTVWFDLVSLLK